MSRTQEGHHFPDNGGIPFPGHRKDTLSQTLEGHLVQDIGRPSCSMVHTPSTVMGYRLSKIVIISDQLQIPGREDGWHNPSLGII